MSIAIHALTPQTRATHQAAVASLERGTTYPLGEDRFEIDHGPDYFAFFDRLGELTYLVAYDGAQAVAVGCGVLREVAPRQGEEPQRVWYVADLKVRPSHRGQRLPWRLLMSCFVRKYGQCRRGYAISMDPSDGSENRILRMVKRFRVLPVSAFTLWLYSLDAAQMAAVAPALAQALGPLSYLSLRGVKDIVLQRTGQPMPLLHVQHGPCGARGLDAPQEGHVHMLCLPSDDPLHAVLRGAGHGPSATATVIHHRMGGFDWRFLLTSDI
jgi:GNAT superfamily N-acetyltransferase